MAVPSRVADRALYRLGAPTRNPGRLAVFERGKAFGRKLSFIVFSATHERREGTLLCAHTSIEDSILRIQIALFEGFDLLDAVAPYEVLETAACIAQKKRSHDVSIEWAAAAGPGPVRAGSLVAPARGMTLHASAAVDPYHSDLRGIVWRRAPVQGQRADHDA